MGYLVVNNKNVYKTYTITNACNKPKLGFNTGGGTSYIPVGNGNYGVKVGTSRILEYTIYTYTANKRTITTGTTYQTVSLFRGTAQPSTNFSSATSWVSIATSNCPNWKTLYFVDLRDITSSMIHSSTIIGKYTYLSTTTSIQNQGSYFANIVWYTNVLMYGSTLGSTVFGFGYDWENNYAGTKSMSYKVKVKRYVTNVTQAGNIYYSTTKTLYGTKTTNDVLSSYTFT